MAELSLFLGFGAIIVFVTFLGYIFRFLRQPLILAYIVAGVILGETFLNQPGFSQTIEVFSQFGVAFLLFLVGVSLEPKVLKQFGVVSALIGISQTLITTFFGFLLSLFFGFNFIESIYIGLALTFASTIIVVKYLSDKKIISTLQGRIAVGAMLVQDFFSIAVILLASSINVSSTDYVLLAANFLFKGLVFFSIAFLLGKFFVQRFFQSVAKSPELLFLSAISWCLVFAAIAHFLGFSIEAGSFVAGVLLASLPYSPEIASRLKNLRDFFIVLFFVALGTGLALAAIQEVLFLAIILSLFVIIVQPLLLLPVMFYLGYRAKTAFFVAITMAQISEFSIIFVALGARLSHVSAEVVSLVTFVAVITMAIGTLLLYHSDMLFDKYFSWLKRFEKKQKIEDIIVPDKKTDVAFLGFGEEAKNIYQKLGSNAGNSFLVDFDPSNVEHLQKKGFEILFADAQDNDVIEKIIDLNPKIVFVATDALETNIKALKALRVFNKNITKFCTAHNHAQAKTLYSFGADFVFVPKMLSSTKATEIISQSLQKQQAIAGFRQESLREIEALEKDF